MGSLLEEVGGIFLEILPSSSYFLASWKLIDFDKKTKEKNEKRKCYDLVQGGPGHTVHKTSRRRKRELFHQM